MPGPMMPGHQMGPQGFMGPMMNGQPGPSDPPHFPMPNLILPGMNDSPLEFNINKNKPPMPVTLDTTAKDDSSQKSSSPSDRNRRRNDKRDRDKERRDDKERREEREKENNSGSNPGSNENVNSQTPITPNMWGGVMGMGYPVMGMNMIVDPNMMGMNNYGMIQPIMADNTMIQQVKYIFYK